MTSFGTAGISLLDNSTVGTNSNIYANIPVGFMVNGSNFYIYGSTYINTPDPNLAGESFISKINLTTGSFDTSFGSNGTMLLGSAAAGNYDVLYMVLPRADNSFFAIGYFFDGSFMQAFLTKFSLSSGKDTGFGTAGTINVNISDKNDRFYSGDLFTMDDGTSGYLLAGAQNKMGSTTDYDFSLRFVNDAGAAVGSFGPSLLGHETYAMTVSDDRAFAVCATRSKQILLSGYITETSQKPAVIGLSKNGSLNTSFATAGMLKLETTYNSKAFLLCDRSKDEVYILGSRTTGGSSYPGNIVVGRLR